MTRTGRIWLDSVARFPLHNTPKKILVKVIQWNLCNPTKIYGPRVFLLISIPTTCKIWHISLVSWFVGLDRFHWSNIPYNVVILEYQQQPLNFPSIKQCNEITNTFVSESLIFSQCYFLLVLFLTLLGFTGAFLACFLSFPNSTFISLFLWKYENDHLLLNVPFYQVVHDFMLFSYMINRIVMSCIISKYKTMILKQQNIPF